MYTLTLSSYPSNEFPIEKIIHNTNYITPPDTILNFKINFRDQSFLISSLKL